MGSTWGPPGSCRPSWAPCWPHESCYQGYPSHPWEISKSVDTPFALFCNAELDPSAFPSVLSEGKLPKEFSWITEGQVGGMAYPDKQEYFRFLANQNVKYVVSLTEQPASAIAVPGEHIGALRWRHMASWRLKSRVSWMSVQQLVQADNKQRNTKAHYWPFVRGC